MFSPFTCIKALVLAGLLLIGEPVYAAKIETLVMPGELIEGHADLESVCTNCHSRFSQEAQTSLCLDCHEDVAEDIEYKQGFHGLMGFKKTDSCSVCHTDHSGRQADVIGLDRALFDHEKTDFPLLGGHEKQQCDSCHEDEKKWREAPSDCYSCHKKLDIHDGRLGEECADCHSPDGWLKQTFNHDETDFPLIGGHEKVQCNACHPNDKYRDIPMNCVSCHQGDDVHRAGYGDECDLCHDSAKWEEPENWGTVEFDHNETDFRLSGGHEKTACSSCHITGVKADTLKTSCISCHAVDDTHRGRNGKDCKSCHGTEDWKKAKFDHDKDTDFHLLGAHVKASCNSCHAGGVEKDADVRLCTDCHKADDAHAGELSDECDTCHKPSGWHNDTRFDHDLTGMPLYGMHALAACENCHESGRYVAVSLDCVECHDEDDVHEGNLGEACGDCHNANGWMFWNFDHDETDFPLTGNHSDLACESCHLKAPAEDTPNSCISCHKADDAHQGRFGRNCERCHSTEGFDILLKRTPESGQE